MQTHHAGETDDYYDPAPVIRIALPAWRLGHRSIKTNVYAGRVSEDELRSMFETDLRPRRRFTHKLTATEIVQIETNRRIRAALKV